MTSPVLELPRSALCRPTTLGVADRGATRHGFHRRHLQWPLLALAALFVATNFLHGDLWLADRLYALEGGRWALQDAWGTQHLVHQIGREFSAAAWLAAFALWLATHRRADWEPLRRPLLYLLIATALSTLLVSWIKAWSNVDCPWDLARYGGVRAYVSLFEFRPEGMPRGRCFPAGHASGAYAWMALYFFLLAVKPQWRWLGLGAGIGAGALFGISQQLRGAHFISHDVAAAAVCWTCAVLVHRLLWKPRAETTEAVS